MPNQPLGPTGLLAQSMTLPAGSQSLAMGGMGLRAQGMDGRKKGGAGNWLGLSGDATLNRASDGAVDGQGNLFFAGATTASYQLLVARYAASGERNWSLTSTGTNVGFGAPASNNPTDAGIALDAAGAVYVTAGPAAPGPAITMKVSAAGQIVWARAYDTGSDAAGRAIAVAPSGNVYVFMRTADGGYVSPSALVVKYSPTGVFQWSRNLDLRPGSGIALDALENVYLTTTAQTVVKLNSAGTVQWSAARSGGTSPSNLTRVAATSSGDVYAVGDYGGIGAGAGLWALDTSGAARWSRGLSPGNGWWSDVLVSGQSVYCIGSTSAAGAGLSDILLAEYDTSGTLKWQRTIGGAGDDYGLSLAEADANTLVIYGQTSLGAGNGDAFIGRVPKSGPPAGKIGPYTVTASTLTEATLTTTFTNTPPANQTLGSDGSSSVAFSALALTTNIYPF